MGPLNVLLLAGEREFAGAFRALVRAFGHHVRIHQDEQAAIDDARQSPPDVVFVDQTEDEAHGELLCRFVREAFSHRARLVAITSDDTSDHLSACRAAGLDFRFSKPLLAEDLERFLAVSSGELLG